VRIGLASGDVLLAEIGEQNRVELLVAGATARRVAEVQRRAAPGAVVIGSATYREVAPVCRALTLSSGLYRVLAIEPPELPIASKPIVWTPRRDPIWELHALIARIEALRPYLVDQHLARLSAGPPSLAGEGDLRPVTVLFACLSDAGPLLEHATVGDDDPALDLLQVNARRLWTIVEQHGGTINKLDLHLDGHTLIALFGAPVAQGHDAERAVSCALALLHDLAAPQAESGPLLVRRIGLATGQVFAGAVGSVDRREYTVMGSVVNLAARLMDVADEGQALLDVATAQVVQRRFQLREQPPALIKGYDEPLPFYVVGAEQRSRISALLRYQELLVGRESELARAQAGVDRALKGRGAIVALSGEAGIGKSRLLAEVVRSALIEGQRVGATGLAIVVVQAQPHSRVRPYGMIAEVFRQLYNLPQAPEQAAQALAAQVNQHHAEHERFLPLLPTIFGLPGDESTITQVLTLDERRARLHDLAVALLTTQARLGPLALVLEDLHWADTASLDLLGALAVNCNTLPLLILCTYRPDETPSWPSAAEVTIVELCGLAPEQSQALISAWLVGQHLPDELRMAMVERTQGNPFFIEETTRALRERGVGDTAPPLPATIQSALLARLDQLPLEERYVLQTAAVIGPHFQRSLLAGVTSDHVLLERALDRLTNRGLLQHHDQESYAFAHSLTHETAYESLLFSQRRYLHWHIADYLRDSSTERAEEDPGLLAYHYRRAEAWPETLEYAWRAGLRAQALYASDLALGHYQHALEAASRLDDATKEQWLPTLLRRLGDLHALAGRYPDAVAAYQDAIAKTNDRRQRAEILVGWTEVCEQQAAYDQALEILDQAAAMLEPEDALALSVRVRRGWVLVRQGAADDARAAVEPWLKRLEEQERWVDLLLAYKVFFQIARDQSRWSEARSYLRLALKCAEQADDIRETARIYNNMAVILFQEGNLREAALSCERSAHIMEEIGDRYAFALIKANIGGIYYKLGDFTTALDHYRASLEIATKIGAPLTESIVRCNLGEIYRQLDRLPESLDQLLRSAELCRQTNDDVGLAEVYRQLAETYIALDQLAAADTACSQAYTAAVAASDTQAEAIVYRVRGILAIARGDHDTAIAETQRSIQMLTELGSTHELGQSMMVQATIWLGVGRTDLARAILEEAILLFQKAGAAADLLQAERILAAQQLQTPIEESHR
jgi:predicted ATPase/class 3 adenylate cyclase